MRDSTSRMLRTDEDWWRIRRFILDTYPITPIGFLWENRRWEGWRFHRDRAVPVHRLREVIRMWEAGERIVGAVHPEGRGDIHVQVHPDFRHLEPEMYAWGEEHLSIPAPDGNGRTATTFAFDYDTVRHRVLTDGAWDRSDAGGATRHLRIGNQPLPDAPEIDGYVLRSTSPDELHLERRMADVVNAGFATDIHTPMEYHTFMTSAPAFRHDLNLIAEAADGTFAAHVGGTFDEQNRRGIVEPVCTDPRHRRRGLAGALIIEAFARFRALGATDVFVDTGDDERANAFYESVGFAEAYRGRVWRTTR